MFSSLIRNRLRWGALIALEVSLAIGLLLWSGALQRLEWITYDYRMKFFRQQVALHPDVAVILIDEASMSAMDPVVGRWPWPRSVYGDLIEFLSMGGARAVLFDILFTENEGRRAANAVNESDGRLMQAASEAGNVFHAVQIVKEQSEEGDYVVLDRPLPEEFRRRFALAGAQGFPERGNNSFSLPFDGLYQASRGVGVVGVDADRDGVFRRVNLFFAYQGAILPSLATAPVLDQLGSGVRFGGRSLHIGDTAVPLDEQGHYLVNMAGQIKPYSIGGIFASIQKLRAGEVENLLVYPDEFAGKIVFVGGSAVGLADIKTTSISSKTPGVMIHASAVSNLLSGDFLRPLPPWLDWLAATALAFATVFAIVANGRVLLQFALPLILALAYGAWAFWAFRSGIVLGMAAPLTAVALTMLATSGYLVFTEGKEKRRVRAMFGQYVSPAVLAQLVDHYKDQARAEIGSREHLSVLFTDVRGFTSISEQLQAEQVVDLLNIHFSVMSEVIFRYDGTLDKFIGDAIVAFWGAPVRAPDHARRAVCAAIEMQRRLVMVNRQLAAKGYPTIGIGVGINTGDVVLGNIGSERKLDYTVIGDQVNLGSRLEGLTKQYRCPVLISESTYKELRGEIPCAVVDLVRVKGKQVPIRIYWPLAHPEDAASIIAGTRTVAELSERAFGAYLARRFEEAELLYAGLPEGPLKELFVARCHAYKAAPPPDEWDGVNTLNVK